MTGSRLVRRGFTLVETLVTLGIFVMVVVALSDIYLLFTRAQQQTLTSEKFVAEASVLLDEIARQVRTREVIFFGAFDYDADGPLAANNPLYSSDADGGPNPASFISGSPTAGEYELALEDAAGETLVYFFNPPSADPLVGKFNYCSSPGLPDADLPGLYLYSRSAAGVLNCNRLFSIPNVEMQDVKFYIAPSYNPYPDSDDDCKLGTGAVTTYNGYYCQAAVPADCPSSVTYSDGRCQFPNQQPRVTIVLKIRDTRNPTDSITLQTTVSSRVYKR